MALGVPTVKVLAREAARVVVADIDGHGAETVAEALSWVGKRLWRCRSM